MKTLKKIALLLLLGITSNLAFAQSNVDANADGQEKFIKPKTLNTYLIERDIPNAGELSMEDLRGVSKKSCDVLNEMGDGIKWIQSYVTDNKVYCVYQAENEDIIREHAARTGVPCDDIMKIDKYIGPQTAKP